MRKLAIALALTTLAGCNHTKALWQTVRDGSLTAGPPSLVAVLATPLGPIVQFCAVFLTTIGAKAITDTAALKAGEISGEGALAKENERLTNTMKAIQGDVEYYAGQAASAQGAARTASTWASKLWNTVLWAGGIALALYLLGQWRWWRNALRWWRAGRKWLALWSVAHAFVRALPDPPLAPAPT